jgi:hypothetical protein
MTSLRKHCAVLLVVALGLISNGCIKSQEAKFPLSTTVPALGEGGRYRMYDRVEGGRFMVGDLIEMRKRDNGGYDFIDPQKDVTPVTLHRIGDGLYAVQSKNGKDAPGYEYILVRIEGGEVLTYAPDCAKQDKAKLTALGVEIRNDECIIDGVKDPVDLFAKLDLGAPTAKLVRE